MYYRELYSLLSMQGIKMFFSIPLAIMLPILYLRQSLQLWYFLFPQYVVPYLKLREWLGKNKSIEDRQFPCIGWHMIIIRKSQEGNFIVS